ncbi:MAG: aspartate carbamoyltransferase regulatory subunit [Clostridiales bacterium GWF2_36_10]|nr:MAG: aspartate carbamoyltransferase regulatory subunit [Clostridiales bacterium GWF2_36_10]HAN21389.1 aspartate carbamoyltransferase regulatory subunit [Clostridiales bacterium]
MKIDEIQNGIVLDHIKAGNSMKIYKYLDLDKLDCTVALIRNVKSNKMGKKDIIKIDSPIKINLEVLGYIDSGITVNIINNGVLCDKHKLELPEKLTNVIRCKNPRCITTVESHLNSVFKLSDREKGIYRCEYCEAENS